MPSLSASIFGFATGIAIADKIDVVTSTHAARLMKSRRRIDRPSFGYPRFTVPGECSESPTVPRNVTAAWTDAAAPPLLGGAALRKEPRADRDVTPAAVASWVWFSHRNLRPWRGRRQGPSGSSPVRALRPSHLNGRNPYSRHKRSVAATTSERSRTSKS